MALEEDESFNDATTTLLVDANTTGTGILMAKEEGILAGLNIALTVFYRIDENIYIEPLVEDGSCVEPGSQLAVIKGKIHVILKGERTALNFLQRMSGIATLTSKYVNAVSSFKAQIVDTRKTLPGYRYLDKYSVRAGGGKNHRMSLADGILVKDNHIELMGLKRESLNDKLEKILSLAPASLKVEVEVSDIRQLLQALEAGIPIIMLDNMTNDEMRNAVSIAGGRALIEASGGITLDNVKSVAETGVDIISVGALTHSTKALDISLDINI
ncbi:MAG: nicotinate-nucleotide diphosphorylase (carboxylating) [Dehalococcoidia bacterium]|nr:nicotinate-nucleotide diphosphorylase (carboxylating) [Dehalococcoidia bacterium]